MEKLTLDTCDWPLIINKTEPKDSPPLALIQLPKGSDGVDAAGLEAVAYAHAFTAVPELIEACKALHDALSYILEDCASADREGEIDHVHGNEYEIGRDHRARAHWALRKSFKVLPKVPGGMEE